MDTIKTAIEMAETALEAIKAEVSKATTKGKMSSGHSTKIRHNAQDIIKAMRDLRVTTLAEAKANSAK